MELSRRSFCQAIGILGGAMAASACDTAPKGEQDRSSGRLRWWDQFLPTKKVTEEIFADFAKRSGGMPVEYDVYDPTEMGKALQLSKQSNQMPDVFTLAGVGVSPTKLFQQDWFAPIQLDHATKSALPEGVLVPGVNVFDGDVYGLPAFNFRRHDTLNWFNRELLEQAGLDPARPPVTYDDFRAAARKVTNVSKGKFYGWIAPLQFTARIGLQIQQLAEAAGSPTVEGLDLRTGEYAYHNDYHLHALEWWLAMQRDRVLFPASSSLNAREARARWATGVAGMFLDGAYNIGVVLQDLKAFADKVAVGPIPVPEANSAIAVNRPPAGGGDTLWISSGSRHVEAASRLLSWFGTKEVQRRFVTGMSNPPHYPGVVDEADVHATFKQAIASFAEHVFLAPDPAAKNLHVADVLGEMSDVSPDMGEIVGAVMGGDISDARKALKKLSDEKTAQRERAMKKVRGDGKDVSVDDWTFPNWKRGEDYGSESYG